jgi:hypothetical protein
MPKKRFSAEQIVTLLRQIEVLMVQGKSVPEACPEAEISQQNYVMSCSMVKSSTASKRSRLSSSNGANALQHDEAALGAQISATGPADIRALGSPSR